MKTWQTVALVVAIVVVINLVSYYVARRASAQAPALASDGGPTR